jgi:hypothetical protein
MRKTIFAIMLCCLVVSGANAQGISFSANYLYLGEKGSYGFGVTPDNGYHGIGIQSKIHLKNRFYLMPDMGYFFNVYGYNRNSSNFKESYMQFYVANVNIGYKAPLCKSFSFLPYLGVGYFHEYVQVHYYVGSGGYFGGGDVIEKDNIFALVANLGFAFEYNLTDPLFVIAGLKYLYDPYEPKNSGFPHFNVGIGYQF